MEEKKSKSRTDLGKVAGIVGILCNFGLAAVKLFAGILSASMSITADALNNLSDAASSIVTLIGFKLAEKPADEDHPYGHARSEYLAALTVSVLIVFIGFELAKSSVSKIINPAGIDFSPLVIAILLGSIAVKLVLFVYNRGIGKKIGSGSLLATGEDCRNDAVATTAVLISGLIEKFTSWKIDGYMGLFVAIFILYSGIKLARETVSPLLGQGANPNLKKNIMEFVKSCPKILGCHDLMVHDYGPGKCFASIHVEMDKNEDPMVCHDMIDAIERDFYKEYGIQLVIHYDPVVTDSPELERLRHLVTSILKVRDERISIHDFRMIVLSDEIRLSFDVAIPMELRGQENVIKDALDNALNELGEGTYQTIITFDIAEFN